MHTIASAMEIDIFPRPSFSLRSRAHRDLAGACHFQMPMSSEPDQHERDAPCDSARAAFFDWEEQRRQFARGLHDQIAQLWAALKLDLQLAAAEPAEVSAARLATWIELAELGLQNARDLEWRMRPPVLDDFGLVAALQWLASNLGKPPGPQIFLNAAADFPKLGAALETVAFRMAEQILLELRESGGVESMEICIQRKDEDLLLTLRCQLRSNANTCEPDSSDLLTRSWRAKQRIVAHGGSWSLHLESDTQALISVLLPV
jgi:signal transduction histidine kinase